MAQPAVFLIVSMLIAFSMAQIGSKGGNCPLKETVISCTPSCVNDYQCSFNQKCCPNKCGHKSCVQPSAVYTGNSYKGSTDTGVLCEGVKCTRWEKCEFDRVTKRKRCVRT